ncbi:MAG: PD40 domain-containing protein, partial [Myxococcales bacterium]|nr:PD40 domain-containing protein [Myxococcales bacterium]
MTTAHFRVHFHQGGGRFAQRTAAIAEEAFGRLSPYFDAEGGDDVVHIVCTDLVDGANGLARTQPYDGITLFAFAPEADTDLARYDDWLRLLVYHELTHVLHLNQAGLLWDIVNGAFGKVYQPNHILPQWFIEGLAVFTETDFTAAGRAGSTPFEQYLRVAALEDTLPTSIGGLTGNPNTPPGGTWAYVFGGDFLRFIAERHGRKALARFVDDYGQRLPLGLNLVAKRHFGGEDLPALFDLWRAARVARARAFEGERRRQGLRIGERLTTGGLTHHVPIFDGDGAVLLTQGDGWSADAYVRRELATGQTTRLFQCDGGCGHAVRLPGGSGLEPGGTGQLLLVSNDQTDAHRVSRELWLLSPQGQGWAQAPPRRARLTHGLRAREPDVDASGRRIAFIAARWGETALMTLTLDEAGRPSAPEAIISFEEGLTLAQPRWVGDRLLYSAQRPGGFRDLWIRDAAPGATPRRLTEDRAHDFAPTVHPDGRTVLYASDPQGIYDLYALDLETGDRWQVTRAIGSAINPAISPDGRHVAYQGWHSGGNELYVMPLEAPPYAGQAPDGGWIPAPSAAADGPPDLEGPRYDPAPLSPDDATVGPYEPWRAVWPRAWAPNLRSTPYATLLGLVLSGIDPVGDHLWTATLDWNTTEMTLSAAASYRYSGLRPALSAYVARWPGEGARFVADEYSTFHMENLYGALSVDVSLPDLLAPFWLGFELNGWMTFAPDRPDREAHAPDSSTPFVSPDEHRVGLRFTWGWAYLERYAYSVSAEYGAGLGMSFELHPTWLGNLDPS